VPQPEDFLSPTLRAALMKRQQFLASRTPEDGVSWRNSPACVPAKEHDVTPAEKAAIEARYQERIRSLRQRQGRIATERARIACLICTTWRELGGKPGMICPLCHPDRIQAGGDVDIFSPIWNVNAGALFTEEKV
jgi:hypothetical protein